MQPLAWGSKVSPPLRLAVVEMVNKHAKLGWTIGKHGSWLMACMAFESAETFSPSVKNAAGSGATGLIQFMPATARGLGTSVEALSKMSAVEQMEYVELYFRPYARRIHTLSDMYMAILMPKYIGWAEDAVLFWEGTTAYFQNRGLDLDKNGQIIKSECSSKVRDKLNKGLKEGYVLNVA